MVTTILLVVNLFNRQRWPPYFKDIYISEKNEAFQISNKNMFYWN